MTRPLSTVVTLGVLAFTARPPAAPAEQPDSGGRVHALIVVDSLDEDIGKSVALDRDDVRDSLVAGFQGRERRLALKVLDGANATPGAVAQYFRDLTIDPADTVLFYFSGHGATHPDRGHVLALGRRPVLRADVLAALKGKKPRLAVCLTDCCAPVLKFKPEVRRAFNNVDRHTLDSLVFRHRGVVDINACSIGELAYCDEQGSLFTRAFTALLQLKPGDLDAESADFVHWQDVFSKARRLTQDNLAELKKVRPPVVDEDAIQTPQAFALPPHRFGAVTGKAADGGVVLARVYRGSPAHGFGLRAGDVVLAVNGRPVRSAKDLDAAVDASRDVAAVQVRKAGAKDATTVSVRLAD